MSMNVLRDPVSMVELAWMETMHTAVHVLLDTLDSAVKQVGYIFIQGLFFSADKNVYLSHQ